MGVIAAAAPFSERMLTDVAATVAKRPAGDRGGTENLEAGNMLRVKERSQGHQDVRAANVLMSTRPIRNR